MKTSQLSFIAIALAVAVVQPASALAQSLKAPSPVEEVIQLNKSGVGDKVILTYIQGSERTYRVNAQDIIKLRDEGVSTEVTTAMIQRGAEQRQLAEAAQQKQTEAAPTTTTVAAAPTYQTQPTQVQVVETAPQVTYYAPVPPVSTVSVHYFGSRPYSYRPAYYPSHRYYTPSYAGYYSGPRVSFGVGYRGGYGHVGYRSGARYCR